MPVGEIEEVEGFFKEVQKVLGPALQGVRRSTNHTNQH